MTHWGLIGHPVAHSFSKSFFENYFRQQRMPDARYDLFDLPDLNSLSALLAANPRLNGLNVTIPHKQHVAAICSSLSNEAAAVGAVNCIRVERYGTEFNLFGYNTDVAGFETAFSEWWRGNNKTALILGTGGSAAAAGYVLLEKGFEVTRVSRSGSRGALTYNDLAARSLKEFALIVNCTPMGMHPDVDSCPPIEYTQLTASHHLFDLVYNPTETLFLAKGRAAGARVQNGLRMLHLQALKSAEIWTKG